MISTSIEGIDLTFETDASLFAPHSIDKGTLAMISVINLKPEDKVLDLGCGYGVVGIFVAKQIGQERVIMCDILPTAVKCSRENVILNQVHQVKIIESNGFENITDNDFTLILSNPPYHADFSVPKHFIEVGFRKLIVGGRLVMVTKRCTWYQRKMISVFGGVKVFRVDGYYVLVAEKRSPVIKNGNVRNKAKTGNENLSKKLKRKYVSFGGIY